MLPALILFAATYVLMLVFSKYRPYIALGSAAIFIITGMLPLNKIIPSIDLNVLLMIGGISAQGVIKAAADLLAKLGGGNVFVLYTVVVWASVLISAFIDNIPYVATMIPVIASLAATLAAIVPAYVYIWLLYGIH